MYNIPETTKADIVCYAMQGKKISDIADMFNISYTKARQIINESGVKLKTGKKKNDTNTIGGKALALWQNGLENVDLIAEKIGAKRETIIYALNHNGIKTRRRYSPIDIDIMNMLVKYKGNLPRGYENELSRKYGISRQATNIHKQKVLKYMGNKLK